MATTKAELSNLMRFIIWMVFFIIASIGGTAMVMYLLK